MVRGRRDSADRRRESIQPAAGPRRRARQGVCRPRRTGGEPRTHRAPVAHRKPGALGSGRGLGARVGPILIAWLAHQGSLALPLLSTLRIDGQALGWTVLIAVFTAMMFGLLPGLRMASGNLQEVLKDSGPGAGLGRRHERVRAGLVVSEVALACVLLVSAGLLMRSFLKVLDVDLGFQPDRAASIKVDYDDSAPTETPVRPSEAKSSSRFWPASLRCPASRPPAWRTTFLSARTANGTRPVPQGKIFAPGRIA